MLPAFLLQCCSLSSNQCVCVLHSVDSLRNWVKVKLCVMVELHYPYRNSFRQKKNKKRAKKGNVNILTAGAN